LGYILAAAEFQFKNKHEITESLRKLGEPKYEGHISDYVVTLRDLNHKVKSGRQVFRDQGKSHMPSEIVNMMYMIGPMPIEEEEFLRVPELAGKRVEEKNREHKTGDSKSYKNNDKMCEKNDKKHKKDNHEKREKIEKFKNKDKVQNKDQKKKRDYKFDNVKEALKGLFGDMITKHTDAKANCWGCGPEGHHMLECYAKKTEKVEEIIMAVLSSARKRKRSDDDIVLSTMEKKTKGAAVVTDAREEKKIWEVESDNEDF
jgi:hypothetical protein